MHDGDEIIHPSEGKTKGQQFKRRTTQPQTTSSIPKASNSNNQSQRRIPKQQKQEGKNLKIRGN